VAARYYNSWIENTDQLAEDDTSSALSEPSSRQEVRPQSPASSDHVPADDARKAADDELSTTHSADDSDAADDDDDEDEDDDSDVFRSFMWVHHFLSNILSFEALLSVFNS